jgi:tRNA G18 (ribose-2'-O)-methylase SpoU
MRKLRNEELGRKSVEEFKIAQKIPIVVVLDNVRSALNTGSVFRTADAFLLEAVYLCGITATPPNPDIHKSALGGENTVSWKYFESTLLAIEILRKDNYKIYAVEQTEGSICLTDFTLNKDQKYAFIFGHEVDGVDQNIITLSDGSIEIPQWGSKHSLNISVSAGIVLWDIANKMKA